MRQESRKAIRTLAVWALVILSGAPLVRAQSLADAAQKERERREKAKAAGAPAKALTEDDLAQTKGKIANDPSQVAVRSPEPALVGGMRNASTAAPVGPPRSPSVAQGESYWRPLYVAAKMRLDEALTRQAYMQRVLHAGQPVQYDPSGRQIAYSLAQLKQMADDADAQVATAQKALDDLEEEGRRAGALPGWFR
jgi:hypothetical protein